MSQELKTYDFPVDGDFTATVELFYLKSEADKVIAEKDEKIGEFEERIDELQKATDSAWSKVNAMYDELRHHKYKRCLAMAKICECRTAYTCGLRLQHNLILRQRWLELADKFKEAK